MSDPAAIPLSVTSAPTMRRRWIALTLIAVIAAFVIGSESKLESPVEVPVFESAAELQPIPTGELADHSNPSTMVYKETPTVAVDTLRSISEHDPFRTPVESSLATSLVYRLETMDATVQEIGPAEIEDVLHIVSQLKAEGLGAVDAIRRYLNGGHNFYVDQTGYRTVRLELIEALAEIGGFEAERVFFEQLEVTTEPMEISLLADILESWAPGEYQESILVAVRETMAMTWRSESEQQVKDFAPLFQTLQRHGGADAVPSLELASGRWSDYATVTLAKLPNGEGTESLVRMARNAHITGARQGQLALEMLAQMAVSDTHAGDALIAMAREGKIPNRLWPSVVQILIGDRQAQTDEPDPDETTQYTGSILTANPFSTQTISDQMTGQTQVIYRVNRSAVLPSEEIEQRLAIIDALWEETSDPAAMEAINQIYKNLYGKGGSSY